MILWNAFQLVSFVSSAKVLFEYQGTKLPTIGEAGDFKYLVHPNMPTDGRELTIEDDHLVINSHPFKHTRTDIFDAFKFHMCTNRRFECNSGKVTVQMTGSAVMHGVDDNPFAEKPVFSQIDSRLAASVFNVQDDKGQGFAFVITNARISAVIEAPLVPLPGVEATSTMGYYIPLVDTQEGKEHTLALILDTVARSVSWSVDGTIHYTWTVSSLVPQENCVLRWGNLNHLTYPNTIAVAFGNCAFLNYYPPVADAIAFNLPYKGHVNLSFNIPFFNPQTGEPAEYIAEPDDQEDRIWRQGAVFRIKSAFVFHEKA